MELHFHMPPRMSWPMHIYVHILCCSLHLQRVNERALIVLSIFSLLVFNACLIYEQNMNGPRLALARASVIFTPFFVL